MKPAAWLMGAATVLAPLHASAQAPPPTTGSGALTANAAEIDVSIPESPGFAVIGFSPTQVVDPSATRITVASAASYVDGNGNLKPGFALGGTPYLWLHPHLTLEQYRDLKGIAGILKRTQVTAGFAEGGDGQPDKVGLGFTFDVLNDGDYRHDTELYKCVDAAFEPFNAALRQERAGRRVGALAQANAELNPGKAYDDVTDPDLRYRIRERATAIENAGEESIEAAFAKNTGVDDCRKQAKERYAKRRSWTVAGGWALKSKGGGLDNADSDGGSFWTAYRQPLSSDVPFYLTAFGRYDFDRKAETPTGTFQDYDRVTLAALGGYEWSGGSKLAFQAGYERLDYHGVGPLKDETNGFYAATLTQRLPEMPLLGDAWLEVQAGSGSSAVTGEKDDRVKVSIRFAQKQH